MRRHRTERRGLRAVFAHPAYRRLWLARTASQAGDVLATVTLAVLVLQLSGSALAVSAIVAVEIAPVLVFAPLAGALADRLPRVPVMIGADLVRAALAVALSLFADDLPAVFALAFGLSLGAVLFNPAAQSLLPEIVDDDELIAANSGIWTAAVLIQIALAPAAGAVYAGFGAEPAFLINGTSFLLSAAVLTRLREPRTTAPTGGRGWRADISGGLRVLTQDRVLRALAASQLLAALSAGATSALLVVLARDRLQAGPEGFGLLLGAIGVGAALGPLVITRLVSNPRRPAFVFGPYALRGVVDLVLAAATALPVAVAALAVYGLATSSGAVTFNSLLQSRTPSAVRGRVFASFDLLWQLGRLASLVLGGVLAAAVGIAAVYVVGGALLLLAALLGALGMRRAA